jgi:plasmid stability protein
MAVFIWWYYATIMAAKKKRSAMTLASVTVRNIPRPTLARLRDRAARHRRSMQGEILAILEAAASEGAPRHTARQTLQRVRALGVNTPAEAAAMIRSDRDGR